MNQALFVLFIGLGGAMGAILRYFFALFVTGYWGSGFPFGTLCVNVIGSFFIGACIGWIELFSLSAYFKAFVVIGLLGAFTTFSTFSGETLSLIQSQQLGKALLNIGLNTTLCLCAAYLGQQLIFFGYK